ncbi:dihydroorotate dehydrogenase-like protein [Euzebya sp.]|uniref:dihydroorotate dehydrogenase-like protein n=1 Tax=Euzebya sp. TaxID=1971409 RepID=UPI003518B99E
MDLSTTYLGLDLRSPLVASPGPLTGKIDSLRALEAAGIAAVVLPSLFEEQVIHDEMSTSALFDVDQGNPEASSYFPDLQGIESISDRYLRHVEEAKRVLEIPVIASLNGVSADGWERYARLIQDAGADALELNLYRVAADVDTSGSAIEAEQLDLVRAVDEVTYIPLAVKVSPYYTAFGHFAARLVAVGADALVLFNRFYQPDIHPQTRAVVPALELSSPSELRLPLRWLGMLHGRLSADLAATTGIHTGLDAARALLAGADVTMMTSALLRYGPSQVSTVEQALVAWGTEHGYASVAELRGSASQANVADPAAFERANYVQGLIDFANSFQSAQGHGPW